MTQDPALKLEIQGHTDNVGSDAYNQPLSEARAHSVATWLNLHDIRGGPPDRAGLWQDAACCDECHGHRTGGWGSLIRLARCEGRRCKRRRHSPKREQNLDILFE